MPAFDLTQKPFEGHPMFDEDDEWGIENIDVPEREIEYQEDDGNSDCGDSCTI